uniref:Tetraspanin n=1 Tax=Oxyrrhis marina TaxID=2969 RepID=A0A7S3UL74_OXYMA
MANEALVTAVAIYLLVSDFNKLLREWWVWVGVAAGIVLIIAALLGCSATHKQNRFVLTAFLFLAGVVFTLLCITAIASTLYLSRVKAINELNSPQLNALTGRNQSTYRFLRQAYGEIYDTAECSGGIASFLSGKPSFTEIECKESKAIAKTLNGWLNADDSSAITAVSFSICVVQAGLDDEFKGGIPAANAWCGSNTTVIKLVDRWSLGILIALWIITAFVLIVGIANCVLVSGNKKKGKVIAVEKPQGVVYGQPVHGGVQVVRV